MRIFLLALVVASIGILAAKPAHAQVTVLPRAGWIATASSSNGGEGPQRALDGSAQSRWTTGTPQTTGQWFKVDMLSPQNFAQITIDTGTSTGDFARGYEVYVSDDGFNWGNPIASGTGSSSVLTITFQAQTARFLCVVQIGSASTNWWSIHELHVYGGVPTPTLVALPRAGWTASGSSPGGGNAIDGNPATRWTTGSPQVSTGQFFQLDLKTAQTFQQITLDARGSDGDSPRGYEVSVSDDAIDWGTPVAQGTGTTPVVTIAFPLQTARHIRVSQTGSATNWWTIHEINVQGPVIGPMPVALSRAGWRATASSSAQNDVPSQALDGNAATRWSSGQPQTAGQWFQIDMLAPKTFSRITLDAGGSSGDHPRAFQVFASDDTSNWGDPIATGNGSGALVSVTFPYTRARYLRVTQSGSVPNWWSIHELNVYGVAPSILPRAGWVATASSSSGGDVASRGIDGNRNTRWSTGTRQVNGQWFQVDMMALQTFSQITLDAGDSSGDFPRGFRVYSSNDGVTWGAPLTTGTGSSTVITMAFAPVTARYIRVVQTGSSASNWWSIHEMNVAYVTAVLPIISGVTTIGGKLVAIFSYENVAGADVHVPHGPDNDLTTSIGSSTSLTSLPPESFTPGEHLGAFTAPLQEGVLTWTLAGLAVYAGAGSPYLDPITTPQGVGVMIGGQFVDLGTKDMTPAAAPPLGDRFYGNLQGNLNVGPTGAATYTVPISIPPGIGGMAPSLSLIYNSQGGDGIAGRGWSLSGLSIIHKCPKTRLQDGIAAPVTTDQLSADTGVCLDGKRLFEDLPDHPGTYFPELKDFSTIQRFGDTFVITTKSGETRFYGLNPKARVTPVLGVSLGGVGAQVPLPAVMWALDRVVDQWGNYFDITYNNDSADPAEFSDHGLLPTEIRYTGHVPSGQAPFHSITFQYSTSDRKDPRSSRFGNSTIPLKKLLTGITTPLGAYSLKYVDDSAFSVTKRVTLPSELERIGYCAAQSQTPGLPPPCLPDLVFGWTGGGFTSMETPTPAYALPSPFDPYLNCDDNVSSRGSQLIDLDGDGLPDVVRSHAELSSCSIGSTSTLFSDAWRNTGAGFEHKSEWRLPNNLTLDGQSGGSVIADIDGDGRPDFVTHYFPGNFKMDPYNFPDNQLCDESGCVSNPSVVVYLNRVTPTCNYGECWKVAPAKSVVPWPNFGVSTPRINFLDGASTIDSLADMNGDGRADFVRVVHGGLPVLYLDGNGVLKPVPGHGDMLVMLNTPSGWQQSNQYAFVDAEWRGSNVEDYHLEDVNRDGLPDMVNRQVDSNANLYIGVNNGALAGNVWRGFDSPTDPNWNALPESRAVGDINGDGFYDPVTFFNFRPEFGQSQVFKDYVISKKPSITLGNGVGYTVAGATGYLDALSLFGPSPTVTNGVQTFLPSELPNYAFSMADLNADGLADVVLNHSNGGQPLINTGATWVDLNGFTSRQTQAGAVKTAFTPSRMRAIPAHTPFINGYVTPEGGLFVDINGDGVTDLVRASFEGNVLHGETYLNTFVPPVIDHFPAALVIAPANNPHAQKYSSRPIEVVYSTITTKDAREGTGAVYSDPEPIAPGTTALSLPMRVVSAVSVENGRGVLSQPTLLTTKYQYQSLRGSAYGRGPQGFRKVIITEPSDVVDPSDLTGTVGTTTETIYSQIFPYTGMPISVTKSKLGVLLSTTVTKYCNKISLTGAEPDCLPADGPGMMFPARSSQQIYPRSITDIAFPIGGADGENLVTTTTSTFDGFGNATKVVVETKRQSRDPANDLNYLVSESHRSTTENWFGNGSGEEAKEGKPTWMQVTTLRTDGVHPAVVHKTALDYALDGGFSLTIPGLGSEPPAAYSVARLALKKKRVEPGSWRPELPDVVQNEVENHTAFKYDAFGNVIVTTRCASDFDRCDAEAANSSTGDPIYHPAFRTTKISYNPGDWSSPPASGPDMKGTVGYTQSGRFPVRTTNAAGHVEYTLYDATTGFLKQRTGPNQITTCYRHDEFGQKTAEIARCGSDHPLAATVARYESLGFGGGDYPIVTYALEPGTLGTWTYSDDFGRAVFSLSYNLDGQLIESGRTTYTLLGQVSTTSAPRAFPTGPTFLTTHKYDRLGPERTTVRDLGQVSATGETGTAVVQRIFQGTTILTADTITDEDPTTHSRTPVTRQRAETKNALGKVAKVVDASGSVIQYFYDGDGNLTDTQDPNGNIIHIDYDQLGRKVSTNDPDLGMWTYAYDGYGDLLEQTDAKQQKTDMSYDTLGRMTNRVTNEGAAEWVYDAATNGVGKLAAMVSPPSAALKGSCQAEHATLTDGHRSGRWFHYAANGDIAETFECTDGRTFSTQFAYDDNTGRQTRVTYPEVAGNRFAVDYAYSVSGHLSSVSDVADRSVLWAATDMNPGGQVTGERTKNGVQTTRVRGLATGWLLSTTSSSLAERGKLIQDWRFGFDEAGNLRSRRRQDAINMQASTEWFGYDVLDRLKKARTQLDGSPAYDATDAFEYDALGNLTAKGGNAYHYLGCGGGPHAVCSVGSGPNLAYDDDGNMTSGAGRTVDYDSRNRPTHIVDSASEDSVDFAYDSEGNRVVQEVTAVSGSGTTTARTVYVGMGSTGKDLYERTTKSDNTVEHTQFIYAGGGAGAFATRVLRTSTGNATSDPEMKYFHVDHLGSVTAISDKTGHVVAAVQGNGADAGVMGYDAWGARRSPEGRPADPRSFNPQVGHREFTGHEAIPRVGLVNMNGRIYDPVVGRFLSPDPTVQFVANLQSYNRYSYVLNNPLSYTDPTGYKAIISKNVDSVVSGLLMMGGLVACAVGGPVGGGICIGMMVANTAWNATAMKAAGADWGDIIAIEGIGLIVGFATGGVAKNIAMAGVQEGAQLTAEQVANLTVARIVAGTVSGALVGAASTAILGGDLGTNIFMGAAGGAAGAMMSIAADAAVSVASAAQGGGRIFAGNGSPGPATDGDGGVYEVPYDNSNAGSRYLPPVVGTEDIDAVDPGTGIPWGHGRSSIGAAGVAMGGFVLGFGGAVAGGLATAGSLTLTMPELTLAGGAGAGILGGGAADKLVLVSRWGRAGLQAGDWVMKGGAGIRNYVLSGKFQPGMGNQFAPFRSGQTFQVPANSLQWPREFILTDWIKGLLGQRMYFP